jgi:ribosomal peptide maturation radical SAM protein 1
VSRLAGAAPSAASGGKPLRVLLADAPFAELGAPSIGLGLLKAVGKGAGHHVETLPLSLCYASRFIKIALYEEIVAGARSGLGEWVFAEAAFGPFQPAGAREASYPEYLRRGRLPDEVIGQLEALRARVPDYLDHCLGLVDWGSYDLVGFTTTCVELNPSLALARRLKQRHPGLRIALGGAKCEGEMGEELFAAFDWIDFVFLGEADHSFPRLLDDLAQGGTRPVAGVLRRDAGAAGALPVPAVKTDLDSLPPPDYDDYFRWFQTFGASIFAHPTLKLEGSRGCWWGQKSLCTFCGLNGSMVQFRSKSAETLLREICAAVDRYRVFRIAFTDNIVDHRYLETLFPRLRDLGLSLDLFLEVKSNLKLRHLLVLYQAGVRRLQPGIEGLSSHILRLMKKGVTGIQNVYFLRTATEIGFSSTWNLLFNFPGETREDYEETLDILQSITHLPPPGYCGPIGLDRFSPYHEEAIAPGSTSPVRILGPDEHYRHILPLPEERLRRAAYSFAYRVEGRPPELDPLLDEISAFVASWRERHVPRSLLCYEGPSCLRIEDRRFNLPPRTLTFGAPEKDIYLACREPATPDQIARTLAATPEGALYDTADVRSFLDSLLRERLVLKEGERYLALAERFGGPVPAARRSDGATVAAPSHSSLLRDPIVV